MFMVIYLVRIPWLYYYQHPQAGVACNILYIQYTDKKQQWFWRENENIRLKSPKQGQGKMLRVLLSCYQSLGMRQLSKIATMRQCIKSSETR